MDLEKEIEGKLVAEVEKEGGYCLKFVSPGHSGVPDRIVFLPGGHVKLIEVKRPNGKLSALQKVWKRRFERLGFVWECIGLEPTKRK
jgi:hypothetical protein